MSWSSPAWHRASRVVAASKVQQCSCHAGAACGRKRASRWHQTAGIMQRIASQCMHSRRSAQPERWPQPNRPHTPQGQEGGGRGGSGGGAARPAGSRMNLLPRSHIWLTDWNEAVGRRQHPLSGHHDGLPVFVRHIGRPGVLEGERSPTEVAAAAEILLQGSAEGAAGCAGFSPGSLPASCRAQHESGCCGKWVALGRLCQGHHGGARLLAGSSRRPRASLIATALEHVCAYYMPAPLSGAWCDASMCKGQ